MPSDLEQKAKELVPLLVGHDSEFRKELILITLREVDAAAEKRTAERCAEIAEGKYAGAAVAEAIRAEFLGGKP